jgi:hypothetical protein
MKQENNLKVIFLFHSLRHRERGTSVTISSRSVSSSLGDAQLPLRLLRFGLIQSNQKIKSYGMLLRSRPLRCKSGKTWAGYFCLYLSHKATASGKTTNALQPHLACIVLPDFA